MLAVPRSKGLASGALKDCLVVFRVQPKNTTKSLKNWQQRFFRKGTLDLLAMPNRISVSGSSIEYLSKSPTSYCKQDSEVARLEELLVGYGKAGNCALIAG